MLNKIFFKEYLLTLLLSFFIQLTFAAKQEITELKNIQDITQHISNKTIVLLDLDNTLITAKQTLGTDQWFEYLFNKHKETSDTKQKALENTLVISHKVHLQTELVPLENTTVQTVKKLQRNAKHVLALTARSTVLSTKTHEQLTQINIDFNNRNQINDMILYDEYNSLLQNGIITANDASKGELVKKLIQKANIDLKEVDKIIFVDDKLHNLQNVSKAAHDLNVNFMGFRYSYADPQTEAFSPQIADKQLNIFQKCGKLVSDKIAAITKKIKSCNIF